MRNDRTIQTRRKAPKSTFTMLYAATRSTKRRKQRAATSAHPEDLGEVPGVGIARALVVILLIHVAAIAGIYLHNKDSGSANLKAAAVVSKKETPPTPREGLKRQFPAKGDNYQTMARRFGVDETELKRVNDDKPIKADWLYNIPARRSESTSPTESIVGRVNPPGEIRTPSPVEHPVIEISDSQPQTDSNAAALMPVESTLPERQPTPDAILIKPRREPIDDEIANAPKAQIVSSGSSHVVKKNETLWGIAQKNGVSVDALMSLNGINKAKGLQIGKTLKIPAKR